ncbi:MAG: bifunctional salicylyl-CoA 5-hydroxylase/oxidoreductase, partial [Myxococcota bacterium]
VRLSVSDGAPGGLSDDDAVAAAAALAAVADAVWVTAGGTVPDQRLPTGRLSLTAMADRVRNETGAVTVASGGIASHADINSVLAAGRADLCGLTRALLFDPHFCRRAALEQGVAWPWPKPYGAAEGFAPRGPRAEVRR